MKVQRHGVPLAPRVVFLTLVLAVLFTVAVDAQSEVFTIDPDTTYLIVQFDGPEFIGKIVSMDAREIVVETGSFGEVAIPRHLIQEIREVGPGRNRATEDAVGEEVFATRYLFTTNGLPIAAGDHYFMLSPLGPDIQFAVAKNFGIGLISTWAGVPLILSTKYSHSLAPRAHVAVGALIGSGTYFDPDLALALPFGSLTLGDRRYNVTLSGGYGYLTNGSIGTVDADDIEPGGYTLVSVAGMARLVRNLTVVFDTFIVPEIPGAILAIPMIRWQNKPDRAWQFGFVGAVGADEYALPTPFIQWFRKI